MFIVIHMGYDCVMLVKIVIHARSDMSPRELALIVDLLKLSTVALASFSFWVACFLPVRPHVKVTQFIKSDYS